ncbi:MAG: hypothetical protein CMJ78_09735 [Planctomycetaceae bacterium]|nr:hypothetical protein [Planctomycetaceae bacterium]
MLDGSAKITVANDEVPVTALIDDGDAGYSTQGNGWGSFANGHNGDLQFHAATNDPANRAIYQFTGLTAGLYKVQATWLKSTNRATNIRGHVQHRPAVASERLQ